MLRMLIGCQTSAKCHNFCPMCLVTRNDVEPGVFILLLYWMNINNTVVILVPLSHLVPLLLNINNINPLSTVDIILMMLNIMEMLFMNLLSTLKFINILQCFPFIFFLVPLKKLLIYLLIWKKQIFTLGKTNQHVTTDYKKTITNGASLPASLCVTICSMQYAKNLNACVHA